MQPAGPKHSVVNHIQHASLRVDPSLTKCTSWPGGRLSISHEMHFLAWRACPSLTKCTSWPGGPIHLSQNAGARRAGTFFDVNSVHSCPGSQSETRPTGLGLAGDQNWPGRLVSSRRPSPQAGSQPGPRPSRAGWVWLADPACCWASSAA
jgi:hypothetical protein